MRIRYLHPARAGGGVLAITMILVAVATCVTGLACSHHRDPSPDVAIRGSLAGGDSPRLVEPAPAGGAAKTPAPTAVVHPETPLSESERTKLAAAPFAELAFVPADVEGILRVDLAAIVERDPEAARTLDFVLHAQQPVAAEFLAAAGVKAGRELATLYLIIGPRAQTTPAIVVAGTGHIDAARVTAVLRRAGAAVEPGAAGSAIFVWKDAPATGVGPGDYPDGTKLGDEAIGVADGLIVVGPPALVRRVLAVRAGEGKDVRTSSLGHDLCAIDPTAATWGVARGDGEGAYLAQAAPGLWRGRFEARLAPGAGGSLALRADFGTPAQANAFREQIGAFLSMLAGMAHNTPVGETLAKLRDGADVRLDGAAVTLAAKL